VLHNAASQLNRSVSTSTALDIVERVLVKRDRIAIVPRNLEGEQSRSQWKEFEIPWSKPERGGSNDVVEVRDGREDASQQLSLHMIVRAIAWLKLLTENRFDSVEALAESVGMHPKVVRQQIQMAFLAPKALAVAFNS